MKVYVVDAFTNEPFKGHPAAVCIASAPLNTDLMQKIAIEMNLSETAFLAPRTESGGRMSGEGRSASAAAFELRWFTPKVEVDLCGHATLASAHVLWETGIVGRRSAIEFHTKSGTLAARPAGVLDPGGAEEPSGRGRKDEGYRKGGWIELDFPVEPVEPVSPPEGLAEALCIPFLYVGKTRFDFLVETDCEDSVRRMRPDFAALEKVPCRGIIVTAEGNVCDFVSRFFAPAEGIREDPVTGSSHCSLAPYWKERLGKSAFTARQVSERGGTLRVRAAGGRTYIAGRAVTVLEGRLVRKGG